jgi:ribonuclease E
MSASTQHAATAEPVAEPAMLAVPEPVMTQAPIAVLAPASASASASAPAPAPVPAPAPAVIAAPAAPFVLQLDQLNNVAETAGLQWVNSDASKIKAAQEAMAREPTPIRVPREIKAPAPVNESALVMVETRKDLSQIKLPFETSSASEKPTS